MTVTTSAAPRTPTRAPVAPATPAHRPVVAWLPAALSLAALLATILPGLPAAVRGAVIVAFWLVVPGLLLAPRGSSSPIVRAGVVPALGVATLGAVSTLTLWTGIWAPVPWQVAATATLSALTAGRAITVTRDAARRRRTRARAAARGQGGHSGTTAPRLPALTAATLRRHAGDLTGGALLAVALLLAGFSLPILATAEPVPYGLLAAAPRAYPLAIALVVVAFALAVRDARRARAGRGPLVRAWAAVGAAVVVLRLIPTLATDVPTYPWTYKHVGVTETITALGSLVPDVDIYHSWPTFFALTAWLTETTGLTATGLAHAITPLAHLVLALGVAALARATGLRGVVPVVAAFVAEVVSWVGQDYFAPQTLAMVLAVATIALAILPRADRPRAHWLAVLCLLVLIPLHQLTPFWVLGVVGVLAFVGRASGRVFWIGAAAAALYVAANWEIVDSYGVLSSASPLDNAATNEPAPQSAERAFGQRVFQATALSLWVPAALALGVRMVRRRRDVVVPGVIAFAPFALLVAQNYGGEGILRVFLMSTPGMAVILAPAVTTLLGAGLHGGGRRRRRVTRAAAGFTCGLVALLVWTGLATQAYLTAWFPNRVTPEQVEVTRTLLDDVPGGAYFSAVGGGWPTRAAAGYSERLLAAWDVDLPLLEAADDDALEAARALPGATGAEAALAAVEAGIEQRPGPTYALFAANSYVWNAYDDPASERDLVALHDAMAADPDWELVWIHGDTEVFRYVPEAAVGSPAATWTPPA